MLEDAIKNDKSQPSETALMMLSFIQSDLPSGGTAAEQRFFKLYGPLCERIFGVIDEEDGYRHEEGGWLAAQNAWPRPSAMMRRTSSSSNNTTSNSIMSGSTSPRTTARALGQRISKVRATATTTTTASNSVEQDPVFCLLATAGAPIPGREESNLPTLIEAISKETEKRPAVSFPFPFLALPRSLQDAWLALVEASMMSSGGKMVGVGISSHNMNMGGPAVLLAPTTTLISANEQRLITQLLRKRPEEQLQLKHYMQQRSAHQQHQNQHDHQQYLQQQPLHLSPRMGLRSLSPSGGATLSPTTMTHNKEDDISNPVVLLSMLEYYLVLFLRFPLAVPYRNKNPGSKIIGVNVHQIPRSSPYSTGKSREAYGDVLYIQIFKRMVRHFLPLEPEENRYIDFSSSNSTTTIGNNFTESELFVRLAMALWLEPLRLTSTAQVVQTAHERRGHTIMEPLALDLDASYSLTVLAPPQQSQQQQQQQPPLYPPPVVQSCVRSLLLAAIQDPGVRVHCRHTGVAPSQLTTCLRALQPAVYNYVRASLRFASIHSSESPFFGALHAWLIWLEPWNSKPCE